MASIGKSYCDYCDGFVQDKIIYSENMIKVLDAENDVLLKFRIAGYNVKVDEGRIYW